MTGQFWRKAAPWVAFSAAAGILLSFAVASPGYPTTVVELHDSGVWVTNNKDDLFGRMNLTAASLDACLSVGVLPSGNLDIFQDDASVVAWDVTNGNLIPVDAAAALNLADQSIQTPFGAVVAMGGGSIAVLDTLSGEVRAARYTPGSIVDVTKLGAQMPATISVDAQSGVALTVGQDGTVYAVAASGELVVLQPDGFGGFIGPVSSLTGLQLGAVAATAVGNQLILLDSKTGLIYLPDGQQAQLPGGQGAVLQQPGPAAAFVYAATATGLFAVPLDGGDPVAIAAAASGTPARPVVVAGNVYGAWSGDPGQAVGGPADGVTPAVILGLDRDGTLYKPVFRVNHNRVILNDMADGRSFDVVALRSLDDWQAAQPPADDSANQDTSNRHLENSVPTANDDNLGARPGRTTLLYVLDNDTDPGGNILAVSAVTQPAGASVSIAEDGQTVMFTAPDNLTGAQTFTYTVSNGLGDATAHVTVTMKQPDQNDPPHLREGYEDKTYPVAPGATIGLFVAQDWRDPDGDPISVVSASANDAAVPVSPQGKIYYAAGRPAQAVDQQIDYVVSDGHANTAVDGKVSVRVLAVGDTAGASPIAQADMVRGVAGVPVTFAPLANDIPGADPRNPAATLTLAGDVAPVSGVTVVTDKTAGTVTATAAAPGTYLLRYTAAFGATQVSPGLIRLEISGQGSSDPITTPDQVMVRGKVPVMVDALANDVDPMNSVLTLTDVQADTDQLSVAVYNGRWVRIAPLTTELNPNPMVVHYWATNGLSNPAEGTITVTQVASPTTDGLILGNDNAVVRCGDTVLVNVLANDASLSGKTLLLDEQPDPKLPSGQLPVVVVGSSAGDTTVTDAGQAFVVGNKVRYVAPAEVLAPMRVAVTYAAATADGGTPQSATLNIEVRPQPTAETPNAAPLPGVVEARAVSGDTMTIAIPVYGIDPDGDSVIVTGIDSAPTKGRVIGFSPTSITYQAFPMEGNNGTDTFTYTVADQYGATGVGVVRVGLAPPGLFPPSVAIDDTVTAQPGAQVTVRPLANDLISVGDHPQIVPVGDLPPGVTLSDDGTEFTATAPSPATSPPVQFSYLLSGTGGDGPAATVTIMARDGFLNPPRTYDTVATLDAGQATAKADPLALAWDIDGPHSALRLVSVSAGVISPDGTVTNIPVTDHVQAVSYVVADSDGCLSSAIIFVPQAGAGAPELLPDVKPIQLAQNASITVNLADYVFSPRSRDVRITQAGRLTAAPAAGLKVQAASPTAMTLTSQNDYTGPAAISLLVADGDPTDATTLQAFVTIPVQIGPDTPVLRCPTAAQVVVQGGAAKVLDITTLCHVWVPDQTAVSYTATWRDTLTGVTATGGPRVTVTASGDAVAPSTGQLMIGIAGNQAVSQPLNISVVAAPKPRLSVANLVDIVAGTTVTQTVGVASPLRDASPVIISVTQTAGPPCAIGQVSGLSFTLTPDSLGVMTFQVVASDISDPSRTDRRVTASFTVNTYGPPSPPSPPQPGTQLVTHVVSLTWTPGADNGAAIDQYEVQATDGRFDTDCGKMTRCDIAGVDNATPVSFIVRAHNKAGWSSWSQPGAPYVMADVPGMPTDFRATNPQDGQLTLTWGPAPVDGSPVTYYHLSWTGGTTGSITVPGDTLSATITGLDNNQMTQFSIVAENAVGLSLVPAATQGQSSGKPTGLTAPVVTPSDLGSTNEVIISWGAATANGPGPVIYELTRSLGAGGAQTIYSGSSTSTTDNVIYDGTAYTYTVTATNASGHTSAGVTTVWRAMGAPKSWVPGSLVVTPTGNNGQLNVSFTYPASNGAQSWATLTWSGPGGAGTSLVNNLNVNGSSAQSQISNLINGQDVTVTVVLCNESGCQSPGDGLSVTTSAFGALAPPLFVSDDSSVADGASQLCATFQGDGNGRGAALHITATGTTVGSNPGMTGDYSSGSTGDVRYCVEVAQAGVTITFNANMVSAATTPARTDGPSTSQSATMPDDQQLQAPQLVSFSPLPDTESLTDYKVCATFKGDGLGIDAHMTITVSSGSTGSNPGVSTDPAKGEVTASYCVQASSPGVYVDFVAYMVNDDPNSYRLRSPAGAAIVQAQIDPRLAPPTNTAIRQGAAGSGDRKVCATFVGNGNQLAAQLHITASGNITGPNAGTYSATGTGSTGGLEYCVTTDAANVTITFSATMLNKASSARPDSDTTTVMVTSASDPPTPSVTLQATQTTCDNGPCYKVKVTTANFTGEVTCTVAPSTGTANDAQDSWTQEATTTTTIQTGNNTDATFGPGYVSVTCGNPADGEHSDAVNLSY